MAKKEKPRNYEDIFKDVQSKEDEISVLTGKINESIRNLVQIETEANGLLADWRNICASGKKGKNCLVEIEKINAKDVAEHEKYDRLRKEKNEKQQELRKDVIILLKNPPKENENKKKLDETDLKKSSLFSGTSRSNIDEVDFTRIFKHFTIDETNVPIEITKWEDPSKIKSKKGSTKTKEKTSTRKEKYDVKSKLSAEDPYYGKIYKGTAMGKEVCVKIITKLDTKQFNELHGNYEKMRKMASHSHLLPPIAASKHEKEPKILVDLVQGDYHSLEDFVLSHDRKQKIGFMTKLKFAKDISSSLAWLHGNKVFHLRLKPSNILFTKDWKIKVADYGLDLPAVPNSPEGWIKSGHAFFYPPELLKDPSKKSNAVDSYSFGLVLYTLLTETFPYTEAIELKKQIAEKTAKSDPKKEIPGLKEKLKSEQSKTIEVLLKEITDHPVQLDDKLYPPKLVNLIKRCTSKNPDERPTFIELTEGPIWSEIYQDMVSAGNEKGQEIWMTAAEQKQTNAIPWDKFANVLWKELDVVDSKDPLFNLQVECVKTMLYLENDMVIHKNWIRFLMWFAPLRTGKDGKEYLVKVVDLLKAPWFYGRECDRVQSDAVINSILNNKTIMDKKENKGKLPFLVRIAISQGEKFCLVCCSGAPGKIQINHVPINPNDYVEIGIFKYITDMAKKKNWIPTGENRFFDTQIFNKNKELLESKDMTESGGEDQIRSVVQPNSVVGKTKYI